MRSSPGKSAFAPRSSSASATSLLTAPRSGSRLRAYRMTYDGFVVFVTSLLTAARFAAHQMKHVPVCMHVGA